MPGLKGDETLILRDESDRIRWAFFVDSSMLADLHAPHAGGKPPLSAKEQALDARPACLSVAEALTVRDGEMRKPGSSVSEPLDAEAIASPKAVSEAYGASLALEGRIVDGASPAGRILVLLFDGDGSFLQSIRSGPDGRFGFLVAPGSYQLEAMQHDEGAGLLDSPVGSWAFRSAATIPEFVVSAATDLGDIVLPTQRGELRIEVQLPCLPFGFLANVVREHATHPALFHLESTDGIERRILVQPMSGAAPATAPLGQCEVEYALGLSPGQYQIRFFPLGWPSVDLGGIEISEGEEFRAQSSFTPDGRSRLWRGVLRSAAGVPLAQRQLVVMDDAEHQYFWSRTDSEGRFAVPWQPGWVVRAIIDPNDESDQSPVTIRLDEEPSAELVVPDDPLLPVTVAPNLHRLLGDGRQDGKYNIVILGDGYVADQESFEDLNSNGIWDGVHWLDLNLNGLYDSNIEPGNVYGEAPHPEDGEDPRPSNEPFDDTNGDGVLSVDDRALFLKIARQSVRALFSSDFFAEHRDAFNVYAAFLPSQQVGPSIVDSNGALLVERTTRYGARWGNSQQFAALSLDRNLALQDGLAMLPEANLVIVLVNQAVPAGRPNVSLSGNVPPVMILQGGPSPGRVNSSVVAHEMGHALAILCDEYADFSGLHPEHRVPPTAMPASVCANSSPFPEPLQVPWSVHLGPSGEAPSLDNGGGTGIYIGSNYYEHGAYRPSRESIMRGGLFFNEPSIGALRVALAAVAPIGPLLKDGFEPR